MTDLEKKAAQKAEEIILASRQDRYARATEFKKFVADALVVFAKERVWDEVDERVRVIQDDHDRCSHNARELITNAKAEGRREGLLRAAERAKEAVKEHDDWMLRHGKGWELEAEQEYIANAIRSLANAESLAEEK